MAVSVVLSLVSTGCSTSGAAQTPRPRVFSGPVSVTGPITISGPITPPSTATTADAPTPPPVVVPEHFFASDPRLAGNPQTFTRQQNSLVGPTTVAAPTTVTDGTELELKKEDLSVRRQTVSNGQVIIRKTVVSEQVNIPVTLSREEYVVERVAADGPPTTPWGDAQAVISMPLTRETAAPVITPRVIERVKVRKTLTSDAANITGTVRTEKLDVGKQ